MLLKRMLGVKPMKKDGGGRTSYAREAEGGALSRFFDEAACAAAGLAFEGGRHGVGGVEAGGEVVFVEGGGREGDSWDGG